MRVKLSSVVISSYVDLGLVDKACNLDIVRCPDKLDTLESTGGNETGAVARLAAPGNFLAFSVTDGRVRLGGSPEAEISTTVSEVARGYREGCTIYVVYKGSLAHRILVLGCGIADVVPDLGATDGGGVVVDLIGLMDG